MKELIISKLSQYRKALVVGTGGGNDIISATLIADYLSSYGIECDVAGILSPGAVHEFNGIPEKVVNKLSHTGQLTRYIAGKSKHVISFIDDKLVDASHTLKHDVDFYDFSLKFGTTALLNGINDLINENGYDVFIEVDVGGDILGRRADKFLLSPLMDFSSLYILDKVNVDSYLIEFGLGTDGELRPDGIREILTELKDNNIIVGVDHLSLDDIQISRFKSLLVEINKIRIGHTATMTLETLTNVNKEDIHTQYYSTWQVGKSKWKNYYDVTLPAETFGKVYLLDGKKLTNSRQDTAFSYETSLEQFIKIKSLSPNWKTELDLCFVDDYIYCLTPSLQVDSKMRAEIIEAGLHNLISGDASYILVLICDTHLCSDYHVKELGAFTIVSTNALDDTHALVIKLKKYQGIQ